MKIVTILFTLLFLNLCSKEEEKVNLKVSDIYLDDIGRTPPTDFKFDIESISDNVQKCSIRTRSIKKNDTIQSIEAFIIDNNLNIDVISSPYDFDCRDDSCFTAHNLSFNLNNFNVGSYNITIRINLITQVPTFQYTIYPYK